MQRGRGTEGGLDLRSGTTRGDFQPGCLRILVKQLLRAKKATKHAAAREEPRANRKKDLQIFGAGRQSRKRAHAGCGQETKWEIPAKNTCEKHQDKIEFRQVGYPLLPCWDANRLRDKLIPPVFARVPAMGKIIADCSTLPKAETPMRSMALPGFHYRQRLNLHRPGCCQAASREKAGFIFDSSRTCRKKRGEFRVPTTPLTIRLRVK